MKNNRAEDIIRSKISTLESEGEQSIDTDKLWQRLNRKIYNKPTKKIHYTYYWLAAASLLIIVFVTLLRKHNSKKNAFVQTDTVASSPYATSTAGSQNGQFSKEDIDPPGLHATPIIEMACYNVKIEDNLLCN
jgi:hypothetical protein